MTREQLKEFLDYDSETGLFTWRVFRCPKTKLGDVAGTRTKSGYIRISIGRRQYMAHVLAWLWMTGEFPEGELDHKDLDGTNNKWSNIRPATRAQNCSNRTVFKSSKTGLRGVQFRARDGVWRARISVNGKRIHLGLFKTKEEAAAAYQDAARALHGEFARAA